MPTANKNSIGLFNKRMLIKALGENLGITDAEAENCVKNMLDMMILKLVGGYEINLPPFGKFYLKDMQGRKTRNPRTGDTVDLPAYRKAKFVPSVRFKEAIKTGKLPEKSS